MENFQEPTKPLSRLVLAAGRIVTSRYCGESSHCVGNQFDITNNQVIMSDTSDPGGPTLNFEVGVWGAFISGVQAGEFDSPQ